MIYPPNTRGFILSSYNTVDSTFLHWHQLEEFLKPFSANISSAELEKIKNELYEQLIEYNPEERVLWLKLGKLPNGMLGLAYGFEPRPYTIEYLCKKCGLPKDKVLKLYRLWENNTATPEKAASITGLNVKTVVELGKLFEDTIPPEEPKLV